jgi:16S rRNA (uracil1498-N3)-methyltransferase
VRITRLYHPEELRCGETIQLDTETSNHLIRVLRTATGSSIILFNGDGFDYSCTTLDENPRKTLVSVESKLEVKNESNLNITLIQGLSRKDRMETTIQKSIELGVNTIIPVLCQRSNTKFNKQKQDKKLDHWRKIAISACEQSGRSIIPEITQIFSMNDFDKIITSSLNQGALKINLNPDSKTSLKDIKLNDSEKTKTTVEIFIGPEGGLNSEEIQRLETSQFKNIGFGPRILRTETAGPAVISALQILWGDF